MSEGDHTIHNLIESSVYNDIHFLPELLSYCTDNFSFQQNRFSSCLQLLELLSDIMINVIVIVVECILAQKSLYTGRKIVYQVLYGEDS